MTTPGQGRTAAIIEAHRIEREKLATYLRERGLAMHREIDNILTAAIIGLEQDQAAENGKATTNEGRKGEGV